MKKNDNALIIKGKDKGKSGKIEKILVKENRAIVAGLNNYKKHLKPSRKGQHAGIIDIKAPIALANLAIICPRCSKITKIKANRLCKKCGEPLDV